MTLSWLLAPINLNWSDILAVVLMLIGKTPIDVELLSNCLKQIDSNLSFELTTEESDPTSKFLEELTYKVSINNTSAKISALMMGIESLGYKVSLLHTTRKLCGS
jgi:hypothetical protein